MAPESRHCEETALGMVCLPNNEQYEVDVDTQALFESYLAGMSEQPTMSPQQQQQQDGEQSINDCTPIKRARKQGKENPTYFN